MRGSKSPSTNWLLWLFCLLSLHGFASAFRLHDLRIQRDRYPVSMDFLTRKTTAQKETYRSYSAVLILEGGSANRHISDENLMFIAQLAFNKMRQMAQSDGMEASDVPQAMGAWAVGNVVYIASSVKTGPTYTLTDMHQLMHIAIRDHGNIYCDDTTFCDSVGFVADDIRRGRGRTHRIMLKCAEANLIRLYGEVMALFSPGKNGYGVEDQCGRFDAPLGGRVDPRNSRRSGWRVAVYGRKTMSGGFGPLDACSDTANGGVGCINMFTQPIFNMMSVFTEDLRPRQPSSAEVDAWDVYQLENHVRPEWRENYVVLNYDQARSKRSDQGLSQDSRDPGERLPATGFDSLPPRPIFRREKKKDKEIKDEKGSKGDNKGKGGNDGKGGKGNDDDDQVIGRKPPGDVEIVRGKKGEDLPKKDLVDSEDEPAGSCQICKKAKDILKDLPPEVCEVKSGKKDVDSTKKKKKPKKEQKDKDEVNKDKPKK